MGSKRSMSVLPSLVSGLALWCAHAYAAPPVDACSVLTRAQVSAILGADVIADRRKAPDSCTWLVPGENRSGSSRGAVVFQPDEMFYGFLVSGNRDHLTPISGVGDEAFYLTTGKGKVPPTLAFKKGHAFFYVKVYGLPHDQSMLGERSIALKILEKL